MVAFVGSVVEMARVEEPEQRRPAFDGELRGFGISFEAEEVDRKRGEMATDAGEMGEVF